MSQNTLTTEEKAASGIGMMRHHPLFNGFSMEFIPDRHFKYVDKKTGYIAFSQYGRVYYNHKKDLEPQEWMMIAAIPAICLAFNFFKRIPKNILAYETAMFWHAIKFLKDAKIGKPCVDFRFELPIGIKNIEKTYDYLMDNPEHYFSLSGKKDSWISDETKKKAWSFEEDEASSYWLAQQKKINWEQKFADGISHSVMDSIERIARKKASNSGKYDKPLNDLVERYPLLGAMASSIKIIDNLDVCQRLKISIAAIDPKLKEIYINPLANLSHEEAIFVIAHELLHAGLNHDKRAGKRDPYYWNVACDFLVNDWLIQMKVGTPPKVGLLYDPAFASKSSEEVYDFIVKNLRIYKKIICLSGSLGSGDILTRAEGDFTDSSSFFKEALYRGFNYCKMTGRGLIPGSLEEEILFVNQPVIPWDVKLAKWFYKNFPAQEAKRTYSRMSRRQGSCPDIPRPARYFPEEYKDQYTFVVILDTSGSMDRHILSKGIGAIVSYAEAHGVEKVRLIFCDAYPYDEGFIKVEALTDKVQVKGRGGTVIQAACDLVYGFTDLPNDIPVLIITDGMIEDDLSFPKNTGFLLPAGNSLPFKTEDVFYLD